MEVLPENETGPLPTIPAARPKDLHSSVGKKEKEEESFESEVINILQTSIPRAQEYRAPLMPDSNADKMFLFSLLPEMKQLNQSASFDFQIKVMQFITAVCG